LLTIYSMLGYGQVLPYACTGSMEGYGVQGFPNSVFIWEVQGGNIIAGNNRDTVFVQWDQRRGTHHLQVVEVTESNCSGNPVQAFVNVSAPVADIGDDADMCEGDSVVFDARTDYFTPLLYVWSDGSTKSSYTGKEEGIVWVEVSGTDGCTDYDSLFLNVNPLPVVYLGEDTALCGNETLVLDAGSDYPFYQWSTGDVINPLVVDGRHTANDTLWVMVTDGNGCIGTDSLVLEVCDFYKYFAGMSNTITPSRIDGKNDVWQIDNIDLFPNAVLDIYDRWGRLVYHAKGLDPMNVWDGKSMAGKDLPMDSYYYVIELNYKGVEPLVGYINIVR
jgi:gliding motility-associated-like protein